MLIEYIETIILGEPEFPGVAQGLYLATPSVMIVSNSGVANLYNRLRP